MRSDDSICPNERKLELRAILMRFFLAALLLAISWLPACAQSNIFIAVGNAPPAPILACPQGFSFPTDGCAAAPAPLTAQFYQPSAFQPGGYINTIAATSANYMATDCGPSGTASCRLPFNVAGADYAIGNYTSPSAMLDPATMSVSGCSYGTGSTGGNLLSCDMSVAHLLQHVNLGPVTGVGAHGCTALLLFNSSSTPFVVDDVYYFNDTGLCSWATGNTFAIEMSGTNSGGVTIQNTYMDGNSIIWNTPYGACSGTTQCNPTIGINQGNSNLTLKYVAMRNFATHQLSPSNFGGSTTVQFSWIERWNERGPDGHSEWWDGGSTGSAPNLTIDHTVQLPSWQQTQFGPAPVFVASNYPFDVGSLSFTNNTVVPSFIGQASKTATTSGCIGATFSGGTCSGAGAIYFATSITGAIGQGQNLPFSGTCGSAAAILNTLIPGPYPSGVVGEWNLDGFSANNFWDHGFTVPGSPATCSSVPMSASVANVSVMEFGKGRTLGTSTITGNSIDPSSQNGATNSQNIYGIGQALANTAVASGSISTSGGVSTLTTSTSVGGQTTGYYVVAANITGCGGTNLGCPTITAGSGTSFTLSANVGTVASEAMTLEPFTSCGSPTVFNNNFDASSLTSDSRMNQWSFTSETAASINCITTNFTPPTITPLVSSNFNPSNNFGNTTNGLRPNGAANGPFAMPVGNSVTGYTGSFGIYFEANVNPNLSANNQANEVPFSGLTLTGNGSPGQPNFNFQRQANGGLPGSFFWWGTTTVPSNNPVASGGNNYATGSYPWTASGGNCTREPSGVWRGSGASISILDPGFQCNTTPTFNAATVADAGAQQTVTSATCATGGAGILVTSSVAVSPGLTPGQQYPVSLTGSGGTSLAAATLTTTSVSGSGPYSVIGTIAGTCPSPATYTGTINSGVSAGYTFPAVGFGGTGITTRNGQHICGMIGEYGDDSSFPGAPFLTMVDEKGNALPGSPALIPYLNQGTANFTGFIAGPSTITGAAWAATGIGQATFTTSAASNIQVGDQFTVSSAVSGYNGTYVAISGTTGSTVVGQLASGATLTNPNFALTAKIDNGSGSSGNQLTVTATPTGAVIRIGDTLSGTNVTGGTTISSGSVSPYTVSANSLTVSEAITESNASGVNSTGTISLATMHVTAMNSYTGSGSWASYNSGTGVVTFSTSTNTGFVPGSEFTVSGMTPSGFNRTYVALTGTNTTTVVGNPLSGPGGTLQPNNPGASTGSGGSLVSVILPGMVVLGSSVAGSAAPAGDLILPYGTSGTSGTGNTGTYQLSSNQTAAVGGGSPGATIFAYAGFYYSAAVNGNPAGGAASVRNASVPGDFTTILGTLNTASSGSGWGGSLGNFAMLYGAFPTQTGGAPSTAGLASICTKAADIQTYATAHGLTVKSLYRLNDPGIWGDSSRADFHGHTSTNQLFIDSIESGASTLAAGQKITGSGLPSGLTISSGSASPYTLSAAVGTIASEAMKAGAFAPALPTQANTFKGYIDTTLGVSTLHVTSFDDGTSHSGFVSFTGTLGIGLTGSIVPGTGSNGAAIGQGLLTVTGPGGSPPNNAIVGIGEIVSDAVGCSSGCATPTTVLALGTGAGYNGTYVVDVSQTVTSRALYGSGTLPGPATAMQTSGTVVGSFGTGMVVSGTSLTGYPLRVTGVGTNVLTVVGNYYAPISADATMYGTFSTVIPGEYVQNSSITNPVKITTYQSGATGLLGNYTLSGSPNAAGSVGSVGSPVVFTGTTITDGGAIAPGPALTILDQGPFPTFPITNSGANTGTLALSGTYDTTTLGGTPTGIEVLVSNSANGSALTGCTPCNWGALTGAITGGKWSGTLAGIPGGGPYLVSVRAANETAIYATLPNSIKVGNIYAVWGQGQADSMQSGGQTGNNDSYASGLWGFGSFGGGYVYGPANPSTSINIPSVQNYAGDRFSVTGNSPPSEGVLAFDQELSNQTGVPATYLSATRDGVGVGLQALGNITQTQTIGSGDGTSLTWCSASKFCSHVDVGFPLVYSYGTLTGGWFTGSATGGVLTATTRIGGALEPGMVLNTANAPTLLRCLTNCTSINFSTSTWALSNSLDSVSGVAMRADPVSSMLPAGTSSTPWPNFNLQEGGSQYAFGGFGTPLVKAGTFKITDTDPATSIATTVCQDNQTFAYNDAGGNCAGANVASSFVNYQTGDYQVTFTSGHAPLSGHALSAVYTAIISPESGQSTLTRPQGLDFFGDATTTPVTGADAALFNKAQGGVNGQIFSGLGTDVPYILNTSGPSNVGYQYGGIGYSQMVSWLFGTKFPNTIPGASPNVQFITTGQWRSDGPSLFSTHSFDVIFEQWAQDAVTSSTFSGTVSGSVLTLTTGSVGPMWEGEVLGCVTYNVTTCPIGPLSGAYITSLASGAWGAIGSTYNLSVSPGNLTNQPIKNPIFYSGSGPAFYVGSLNDIIVQNLGGLSGTTGRSPHPEHGFTGARRATSRWAAMVYGANNSNPNADPKFSRANDSVAGTPSPAFDYSTTYQASHAATWSGNTVTITGGLAAHARPFVVGQAFSCASCASGLVITSLSVPPTESTVTGAGEVGQTFTFKANNAAGAGIGGSGTGTVTAGCTTGSGGSNCINIDVSINVSGTFGTAAAIANCGANNLNGNAPNYIQANGTCQDNGIGEIVRTFIIGTNQSTFSGGSVYDDGVDPANGSFTQSSAYTCNIVAAKVVQCVKSPSSPVSAPAVGVWTTGSAYVAYGDMDLASGRIASLVGYVGGQSFPFTAGSGYTPGTTQPAVTCSTVAGGGSVPRFDVTVSGAGAIVSVTPSAATFPVGLGVGSTCTVALPSGGSGGAIPAIQVAPLEGIGGIATYNTESNTMGMNVYDNSGFSGNPLNQFFTNGQGGYFEPGLPLRPVGMFQGAAVSDTSAVSVTCTGGTHTSSGSNTVISFTSSGTLSCTGSFSAQALVIGGGGGATAAGGGGGGYCATGGSTACSVAMGSSITVPSGSTTVTVGAGGAGHSSTGGTASNGGNSVLGSIATAPGGGGGGSNDVNNVAGGGSGGGAGPNHSGGAPGTSTTGGVATQGNNGGSSLIHSSGSFPAAGGGGAGAVGGAQTSATVAGNGGNGLANSITGSSVTYAGGGGAGAFNSAGITTGTGGTGGGGAGNATSPVAGTNGLGGGGGGAASGVAGAAGGSGVVILSCVTSVCGP